MLEGLQSALTSVFGSLRKKPKMTEANIAEGVQEIRLALLEADVHYQVVKILENRILDRALGERIIAGVDPVSQFYAIVQKELLHILEGNSEERIPSLPPKGEPGVVLLVGLQGSGKTTTAGKLALSWKEKTSVLLVGADVYRPSAREQLKILAQQANVSFFTEDTDNVSKIVKKALEYARKNLIQTVIIDTAGRLAIDDALMRELRDIKSITKPQAILLAVDAMMGQNAVSVAQAFDGAVDLTGVVLTKFDSEAKAGAALSIREVTGKPILYTGEGEKLSDLEVFHPDRLVGRILGRGDILSLSEKAQKIIDEKEAKEMGDRLLKGQINLDDFLKQIQMMKKLGGLGGMLKHLPMMPQNVKNMDANKAEQEFSKMESMIFSMTKREKQNPRIIEVSRKKRIAKGAGRTLRDVTLFLEQVEKMGKMMKKFSRNAKLFGSMGSDSLNLDVESLMKKVPGISDNLKNWTK